MSYTQQSADWVIKRAFVHAQRKGTAPVSGTDKYNVLLAIVDSMQKLWATEPSIEWNSLYATVPTGTITTATTYDLDDSIDYISKRFGDFVTATSADGTQVTEYKLVSPDQLYGFRYQNAVAQVGRTLRFSRKFLTTDTQIGYTIKVPAMTFPDDIASGSDLVQVDDPMWLVFQTAAEWNRSDVVKMGQYSNLLNIADQLMQKMKSNNSGQYESVPLAYSVMGETWL